MLTSLTHFTFIYFFYFYFHFFLFSFFYSIFHYTFFIFISVFILFYLGRRASIDFLKSNKDLTKEIEVEVRKIMAEKLSAGGVASKDEYDEEDGEENEEGEGEFNDEDNFQQS